MLKKNTYLLTVAAIIAVFLIGTFKQATAKDLPLLEFDSRIFPKVATSGMVVSQEAKATEVGVKILKQGGNAVDAAVAVGFALAVTLPRAGNIGGGGFMMIYDHKSQKVNALDYREIAPQKAQRDMFLDSNQQVNKHKARFSNLSAGVPGTVAGLVKAHDKYGLLPFKQVVQPAIELATQMSLSQSMAQALNLYQGRLSASKETRKIYTKSDRSYWREGDLFKQTDLAQTLKRISASKGKDFYEGKTAQKMAHYFNENNGIITLQDLNHYKAVWRTPIKAEYGDVTVFSMPPPSSGGIHLIQLLNIINQFPIDKGGANSAYNTHLKVESMKFAYADRSKYLGDPDFTTIPTKQLISNSYAKSIATSIKINQVTPSKKILPGQHFDQESPQTTHFSVADQYGNMVSNTYTLNYSFGSGLTVPGTGMLLNNQMDDFTAKAGTPNSYGLLGGTANAIEPFKRPLSSMTPVIVLKDNQPWLATGSPGGSKIISIVFNFIVNRLHHSMNIAEATMASRVHHQWYPDVLKVEKGFPIDSARILKKMGHKVQYTKPWGSLQSIEFSKNIFFGFSDTRRPGALAKGLNINDEE